MIDESQLLYTQTHEWLDLGDGGSGTVGITRFAVDQLTDVVYVELPPVGMRVAVGQSFGVIESVKAVSDLYAPVSGEVLEVNRSVVANPALLNEDPYEEGWLIKIKLVEPVDKGSLMDKSAYDAHTAAEQHGP